ncbi:MAG TPA: amidohydrolase family protein [Chthonomonadaceae bacterium]|nr:amidohydrolase family protein [Chthonomonadaceae bacterium]
MEGDTAARRIDCHNHIGVELINYLNGDFPYAQMLPALVAEGRAHGITDWIVFPMVSNLTLNLAALRAMRIESGGLEQVPYAFENRRLLCELHDLFPHLRPHVYPFAMVDPMREPLAQANALRELRAEHLFYGLKMQTTMLQSDIRALLQDGRIFLDLAREWDIPMLIHTSVYERDRWAQAADILDIVEATPEVRFCLAHSCRFDRVHLDRLAALPNAWFDCSAHRIHCCLAMQDSPHVAGAPRRFDSDYSRPERVLRDLALAYPNKLLWGSDSPYYSFASHDSGLSLFSSYAEEVVCLDALPTTVQSRIACENTLRCFGLKARR